MNPPLSPARPDVTGSAENSGRRSFPRSGLRGAPGLWVFVLAWSLYLLTASYHLSSPDGELYFRTTESLATFQGLAIEPLATGRVEVATEEGVRTQEIETFGTKTGRNGREYSQYGIGLPLVAVPFYWAALAIEPLAPPIVEIRRMVVSLTNTLVTALLALFVYLWVRRLFESSSSAVGNPGMHVPAAVGTALLFTAATYAWPQAKYLYSEPLAALFLLASLYVMDRAFGARRENILLLIAGALAGLAILTRLDSAVAGLGFLALLWVPEREEPWRPGMRLRRMAVAAVPVLVAVGLFAWMNYWRFGNILATGYGDQAEGFHFDTPLLLGLHGLLLSTGRGMLVYSPLFILTPVGLWLLMRARRPAAWCLVLLSLGFVIAMAKWQNWEGGWCWGPRHIYQVTPFWAIPLGCLLARGWKRLPAWGRAAMGGLALASVVIQILGVSQNAVEVYRDMGAQVRSASLFEPAHSPLRYHGARFLNGEHDFGIGMFTRAVPPVGMALFVVALAGVIISSTILLRSFRGQTE